MTVDTMDLLVSEGDVYAALVLAAYQDSAWPLEIHWGLKNGFFLTPLQSKINQFLSDSDEL